MFILLAVAVRGCRPYYDSYGIFYSIKLISRGRVFRVSIYCSAACRGWCSFGRSNGSCTVFGRVILMALVTAPDGLRWRMKSEEWSAVERADYAGWGWRRSRQSLDQKIHLCIISTSNSA